VLQPKLKAKKVFSVQLMMKLNLWANGCQRNLNHGDAIRSFSMRNKKNESEEKIQRKKSIFPLN
jgi:hypothetical protein